METTIIKTAANGSIHTVKVIDGRPVSGTLKPK